MRKHRAGGVLMLFAAAAVFAGGTAYRQSRRPPLVMTVLNQPAQSVVRLSRRRNCRAC